MKTTFWLGFVLLLIVLSACGEPGTPSKDPKASIDSTPIVFAQGESSKTLSIVNSGAEGSVLSWKVVVENVISPLSMGRVVAKPDAALSVQTLTPSANGLWFSLSPNEGTAGVGTSNTVTLTLNNNLPAGSYSADIVISSNGGSDVRIPVSLDIASTGATPAISVSTNSIVFVAGDSAKTFNISNSGAEGSVLSWSVSVESVISPLASFMIEAKQDAGLGLQRIAPSANGSWFTVSPNAGTTAVNASSSVTVSLVNNLPAGTYRADIVVSSDGGADVRIPASLVIDTATATGELFNSVQIVNPFAEPFTWAMIPDSFTFNGNASSPWLDIVPANGVTPPFGTSLISLYWQDGLAAGQYGARLVLDFVNGQDFELLINAQVGYPDPVIPVAVDFGSDASVSFDISNRAGAATSLEWSLQLVFGAEAWFSSSQSFGSVPVGQAQSVTFNLAEGLAPGDYSAIATVFFNGGSQSFPVTATVAKAEAFVPITPLSLATTGSAQFGIQNPGPASSRLTWEISDGNGDTAIADWLVISPDAGVTPGGQTTTVVLTLKDGLPGGFYSSILCVKYSLDGQPAQQCFNVSAQLEDNSTPPSNPDPVLTLAYDAENYPIPPIPQGFRGCCVPIEIAREHFEGPVTLEVVTSPAGVNLGFVTNPTAEKQAYMSIDVTATAAPGSYELVIRGSANGVSDTVTIPLTVEGEAPSPDFTMSVTPNSLSINGGSSANSSLQINPIAGFSSPVTFSASNVPSGITVSFNPNPSSTTTAVAVNVASNVAAGQYALKLKGSSGSLTKEVVLNVTVVTSDPETARIQGEVVTDNDLSQFEVTLMPSGSARDLATQGLSSRPEFVPGQVLVKVNTGGLATQAAREDLATAIALDYGLSSINVGTAQLPSKFTIAAGQSLEAVIAQLSADPRVVYAEPNYYIYPLSLSGDAQFFKQWALPYSGVPVAWDVRDSSDNIVVAVLDTGIDLDHPDLAGVFLPGRDFCGAKNGADCATDNDPRPELTGDQHGTHVTGIIAAKGNTRGVAGVVRGNVIILPIKVFFQGGFTTAEALAAAIVYASENANIMNLSLGTEAESQTLLNAVNTATGNGALIIAAAGNFGKTSLLAPARYAATNNQVAAIGSVNSNFRKSCFSHTGQGLTLMAVGGDFDLASAGFDVTCPSGTRPEAILSTIPGDYGLLFGTSQATPLVSGVAALVWAANPSFSARQVLDKLKASAHFDASFMTANAYGAGIVRADKALGIAGPGDALSITAEGDANSDSAVGTVTLELNGTSTNFDLSGLKADRYTLMANGKRLSGSSSVSLGVAQNKNNVKLKAKAQ